MADLNLLPPHLAALSISSREIVLPMEAALEAIDYLETRGLHVLGWEGWVKDSRGRVGHGNAPQGTVSLDELSVADAAQFCRDTITKDAETWASQHPDTDYSLYFCITVGALGE